jgi:predicted dehydrogenase
MLRAAALGSSEQLQLTAACDVDGVRATAAAGPHGAACLGDWRELVRREDVDAVIVATPPDSHPEVSIEALRQGKDVLCEKPLAPTGKACREMVEAAAEADRILATGFNYRFYPSVKKGRELLAAGTIGELDHVRSYAGYSATDHSRAWIQDSAVTGGGALWDNGIHLIDLTRHFLGEVEAVTGLRSNSVWGFERCEDNGATLFRSSAGKLATLQASWTEWQGYRFKIELYGTTGCILISCFPMITRVLSKEQPDGPSRRKMHLFPRVHVMEKIRSYRWVVTQSLTEELEAFAGAVQGGQMQLASGLDGLRAVELAEAAAFKDEPVRWQTATLR